jgi:hypothetical protein
MVITTRGGISILVYLHYYGRSGVRNTIRTKYQILIVECSEDAPERHDMRENIIAFGPFNISI